MRAFELLVEVGGVAPVVGLASWASLSVAADRTRGYVLLAGTVAFVCASGLPLFRKVATLVDE